MFIDVELERGQVGCEAESGLVVGGSRHLLKHPIKCNTKRSTCTMYNVPLYVHSIIPIIRKTKLMKASPLIRTRGMYDLNYCTYSNGTYDPI